MRIEDTDQGSEVITDALTLWTHSTLSKALWTAPLLLPAACKRFRDTWHVLLPQDCSTHQTLFHNPGPANTAAWLRAINLSAPLLPPTECPM